MCSAEQDGCVVNLNNQAAAIMARHDIPVINLHDAITGECGAAPNASCFGEPHCFCPHCSPGNGVGYEYLANTIIVPALTKLLPHPPAPPPAPPPGECTSDLDCSLNGACEAGKCRCALPWSGSRCGELQFAAKSPAAGRDLYNASDLAHNTWYGFSFNLLFTTVQ
jgi:hypothetical protein